MSLIERYIYEVGRHLPRKNRSDIQAELRSSLVDALEDQAGGDPSEEEITEFLKGFGAPKDVAASYHPEGQYLIGPALYPLFRMVAGIAIAATMGAQLLAWGVAIFLAQEPFSPWEALEGLISSIPVALGMVVIVFAILERVGVRAELDDDEWDPQTLPEIHDVEPVKRGERIFGIVAGIVILVLLVFFPEFIGFVTTPGGEFFSNPVLLQYRYWISLLILVSIGLDSYLVWQGRWSTTTRIAKVVVNVLSLGILSLLVLGHNEWLAARGAGSFFMTIERIAEATPDTWQMLGMQAFRMAFGVALIVSTIETLVMIYRMLRGGLDSRRLEVNKLSH